MGEGKDVITCQTNLPSSASVRLGTDKRNTEVTAAKPPNEDLANLHAIHSETVGTLAQLGKGTYPIGTYYRSY